MQKFKREKWSNSVTQTSAICWLKTPVCITEGRTLLQTRSSNPSSGRTPWVRLQPSLLHNCSSPPTNFHREDAKPRTGNPDPAPPRGGKRERRLVHNSPQRPPVHIKVSQSWARGQLHAPAPHTCARRARTGQPQRFREEVGKQDVASSQQNEFGVNYEKFKRKAARSNQSFSKQRQIKGHSKRRSEQQLRHQRDTLFPLLSSIYENMSFYKRTNQLWHFKQLLSVHSVASLSISKIFWGRLEFHSEIMD